MLGSCEVTLSAWGPLWVWLGFEKFEGVSTLLCSSTCLRSFSAYICGKLYVDGLPAQRAVVSVCLSDCHPTCRDWMPASLPIRIDVHLCLSMLLLSSWHNRRLNVGWHSLRTSCDTGPPASCCFCCTFLSFPTSFRSDTGHRPLSLG